MNLYLTHCVCFQNVSAALDEEIRNVWRLMHLQRGAHMWTPSYELGLIHGRAAQMYEDRLRGLLRIRRAGKAATR